MTNKKGRTESAQPQNKTNSPRHSTPSRAEAMIPELVRAKFRAVGRKLNHGGVVSFLRRQGFIHRQIERALDEMVARGEVFFVVHETRDRVWIGRQSVTQWRTALEIWESQR